MSEKGNCVCIWNYLLSKIKCLGIDFSYFEACIFIGSKLVWNFFLVFSFNVWYSVKNCRHWFREDFKDQLQVPGIVFSSGIQKKYNIRVCLRDSHPIKFDAFFKSSFVGNSLQIHILRVLGGKAFGKGLELDDIIREGISGIFRSGTLKLVCLLQLLIASVCYSARDYHQRPGSCCCYFLGLLTLLTLWA